MSEIQVASRYAKSLIDLAEEQNALEPIKGDIETFVSVLKKNSQLAAVLRNPIINQDKKLAILNNLFGKTFNKVVLAFFRIMVSKGRSEVLFSTGREFLNEYNKREGIIRATVTSAVPLSEPIRKEIEKVVVDATKCRVVLEPKVDRDLIGGFILKVGDRQFDASIASKLSKLKKEFSQRTAV